jgi:NAD(P)-dependent dehydrogenase (short-subunit alcohol dehydrogenase family)
MAEDVWQKQLDLNLTSAFLACKHVLPVMERQFKELLEIESMAGTGDLSSFNLM